MKDDKLYLDSCVRAIRQATYGKDNRQPIVMALNFLKPVIAGYKSDEVTEIKETMQRKIDEFDTVYHSFNGGNVTLISDDSFRLNL